MGPAVRQECQRSQGELALEGREGFSTQDHRGGGAGAGERGRGTFQAERRGLAACREDGGKDTTQSLGLSLFGRHRLLLPAGRSSARSREGQLRKRYTGCEALENVF